MAEVALLVDTDVLVDFFRGSPEAGRWLADHQSETIGIPVIVLMELLQGARSPAEQRAIREPLERFGSNSSKAATRSRRLIGSARTD